MEQPPSVQISVGARGGEKQYLEAVDWVTGSASGLQ